MADRRLSITKPRRTLLVERAGFPNDCVVYILTVNKSLNYDIGKSRIAYIGTTKNGISRVAGSAAQRSKELFDEKIHGVNSIEMHVISTGHLEEQDSWRILERAMLIKF